MCRSSIPVRKCINSTWRVCASGIIWIIGCISSIFGMGYFTSKFDQQHTNELQNVTQNITPDDNYTIYGERVSKCPGNDETYQLISFSWLLCDIIAILILIKIDRIIYKILCLRFPKKKNRDADARNGMPNVENRDNSSTNTTIDEQERCYVNPVFEGTLNCSSSLPNLRANNFTIKSAIKLSPTSSRPAEIARMETANTTTHVSDAASNDEQSTIVMEQNETSRQLTFIYKNDKNSKGNFNKASLISSSTDKNNSRNSTNSHILDNQNPEIPVKFSQENTGSTAPTVTEDHGCDDNPVFDESLGDGQSSPIVIEIHNLPPQLCDSPTFSTSNVTTARRSSTTSEGNISTKRSSYSEPQDVCDGLWYSGTLLNKAHLGITGSPTLSRQRSVRASRKSANKITLQIDVCQPVSAPTSSNPEMSPTPSVRSSSSFNTAL